MSEMIPIKTLNGHPLVDTEARAAIEAIGSGSGSGGAAVAILNANCQFDPENRTFSDGVGYTPFSKLLECYEGGGLVWCRLSLMMGDMLLAVLECAPTAFEGNTFTFEPLGALARELGTLIVVLNDDNSVNVGIE